MSAFGADLPRLAARRLVIGAWIAIGTGVFIGLVSLLRQPNVGVREGTERPVFLIVTAEGAIVGTPGYIAPELAFGGEASPASDLYSLACVAYWLLTGRLVFGNLALVQQIYAHGYETPLAPSTHADVDPALDELVMRCLAKKPEDRPASAAGLADALQRTGLAAGWTDEDAAAWWAGAQPAGSVASVGYAETVELTAPAS